MRLKVDDITGVERSRRRRVVSFIAVAAPIVVLAGSSAWFIRAYVMPPMVTIAEPLAVASVETALARNEPPPPPTLQTTGTSLQLATGVPAPAVRYSTNSAEIWASVPLPGPPRPSREMQSLAAAPTAAANDLTVASVPLPPRRPRMSTAEFDLPAVPLPRPRPFVSN